MTGVSVISFHQIVVVVVVVVFCFLEIAFSAGSFTCV